MSETASPVWLITGASSGLGAYLALYALKAGHRVLATARNVSKAEAAFPEITKLGGQWLQLDVSAADVEAKVKKAATIYGRLDVVVNNAGYSLLGACEDIRYVNSSSIASIGVKNGHIRDAYCISTTGSSLSLLTAGLYGTARLICPSDAEAHEQMETNFFGPLKVIRGALPTMRNQEAGTIVNITSIAALDGLATCSLYAGSKFALEGASESLAREVSKFNIRVLLVEPGAFRTNFLSAYDTPKVGISEPYKEGAVADVMNAFQNMNGSQKGNTEQGVARIFEVVTRTGQAADLGEILRLPLGSDCVDRIEKKIVNLQGDLDKTRSIALSTDFA
ncbi:hypothetical protein BP5796_01016 [Coleophoma crateriformis]|uniref:Uncharacterized protein n=1 Tax=Coleophoma crateriformis TaxID=565419 RepID=A0A3D8T9L9_9HELO|nr:hypothetical protein BP5796_01016 [Coleophoma crateriformis]